MISVMVVDDQDMVRSGLVMVLRGEPDIEVVAESAGGTAAVAECRRVHPNVLVVDVRMPEIDGLEIARLCLAERPAPHVLMLTSYDDEDSVLRAVRIGAAGFLLKSAAPQSLCMAVRALAAGQGWLEPSVTRPLLTTMAGRLRSAEPPAAGLPDLSARELDVLRLAAAGLTNTEIAAELVIAESTVKSHMGRLLQRLDARDRVQVVIIAHRYGLVR